MTLTTSIPREPLYDRALQSLGELHAATGVNVDLWDGLEVSSLLLRNTRLVRTFFPLAQVVGASLSPEISLTGLAALTKEGLARQDTETYGALLGSMLGDGPMVLSPESGSGLWTAYTSADYGVAFRQLEMVLAGAKRRAMPPSVLRSLAWVSVTAAAISARRGAARRAIALIRRIGRTERLADVELNAWCWNVLAMAYGKLDMTVAHERAVESAVLEATAGGAAWLASTVALRAVHKKSWAAGEAGLPMDNAELEDALQAAMTAAASRPGRRDTDHVTAQREAYRALQYTWRADSWDDANRSLIVATVAFEGLGDTSEIARLLSERGRLMLLSGSDPGGAVRKLHEGLEQRTRTGDAPRVRYDLLWLAEAYEQLGDVDAGELCAWAGLTLHRQLYGSLQVDSRLVARMTQLLEHGNQSLVRQARTRRLQSDELVEAVGQATLLPPETVVEFFDIERLRSLVRETAP